MTHKPVEGVYFNLLANGDKRVDCGITNKKGKAYIRLYDFDSNTIYTVTMSDERFKTFSQKLEFKKKEVGTIKIKLYPDSNYSRQKKWLIYKECDYIAFGDYEPKEPHSLNELPDTIRTKLVNHLMERLGKQFYSKLSLSGGQIVDIDRMHLVDPKTINFEWTVSNYYLCFSFSDTNKGIGQYTGKIVLDKNGNIINELTYPDIKNHPEKANIISLSEAKKVALANGWVPQKSDIKLDYSSKYDSITWFFEYIKSDNGLTFTTQNLVIDAHNGNVLDTYSSGGIR